MSLPEKIRVDKVDTCSLHIGQIFSNPLLLTAADIYGSQAEPLKVPCAKSEDASETALLNVEQPLSLKENRCVAHCRRIHCGHHTSGK